MLRWRAFPGYLVDALLAVALLPVLLYVRLAERWRRR